MKKIILLFPIFLIVLVCLFNIKYYSLAQNSKFKVIKIVDADTFYIDYNKDGYAQKNEKVRIKHSDGFETSFKKPLDRKSTPSMCM